MEHEMIGGSPIFSIRSIAKARLYVCVGNEVRSLIESPVMQFHLLLSRKVFSSILRRRASLPPGRRPQC